MKLSRKILMASALAALLVALPAASRAASSPQNNLVRLAPTDTVNGDFVHAAATVEVAGSVSGDVMTAGGQVDVSGTVGGDVLAAGGNLTVSGTIGGSLRTIGGNLDVRGTVGKNASSAGGSLTFERGSEVRGNVYVAGGNTSLRGTVDGTVQIAGGNVVIEGTVRGDVTIAAGNITVAKGATIAGALVYYSDNPVVIESGATITGPVTQHPALRHPSTPPSAAAVLPFALGFLVWKFLAYLLVAYVAWKLFPAQIAGFLLDLNNGFWPKFGWGLVSAIVIPIAAVIACVTLIGLPLGLIALVLFGVLIFAADVLGILFFGKWLSGYAKLMDRADAFPWLSFLVGAIVLGVISLVPLLGAIVKLVVVLWSFGMIVRALAAWKRMAAQ